MRALVRCRQPRRAAAAQAHRTSAYAYSPQSTRRQVLCHFRLEPAHDSQRRQTRLHVNTRSHKRKAAAVVIGTEALVCSGLRCSLP